MKTFRTPVTMISKIAIANNPRSEILLKRLADARDALIVQGKHLYQRGVKKS